MKRTATVTMTPLILGGLLLSGGCEMPDPPPEMDMDREVEVETPPVVEEEVEPQVTQAVADISPLPGVDHDIRGQVSFHMASQGTAVTARIRGLDPQGVHGFHVHQGTDCQDPGDHLAPYDHDHGGPMDPRDDRHKGDMGNLEADEEGVAEYEATLVNVTMDQPPTVIGHVVVIHEEADDMETQPDGDAGDPVACGVIRLVGQ